MLRRGTIVVGSLVGLMLVAAPGWTFPARGRGASMGTSMMSHTPGAFVHSSRGFPAFGTGTSTRSFPAFGTGTGTRGFPTFGAGTFAPARNGVFVPTTGGGNFIPGVTSGFSPVNPAAFVSPLANSAINQSAYAHTLRQYEREQAWANGYDPYWYNPYAYGGYGYGAYGWVNPYTAYGSPYYGAGLGYGTGYGYGTGAANVGDASNTGAPVASNNAGAKTSPAQTRPAEALKAFGIPVEFGEVKWPLALRLMPPDAKRDLLDKLESQMKLAAKQAIDGTASQVLLRETKSTLDSVSWWMRGRRSNMAETTYQEGDAFLRRLEDSLRRMDS